MKESKNETVIVKETLEALVMFDENVKKPNYLRRNKGGRILSFSKEIRKYIIF